MPMIDVYAAAGTTTHTAPNTGATRTASSRRPSRRRREQRRSPSCRAPEGKSVSDVSAALIDYEAIRYREGGPGSAAIEARSPWKRPAMSAAKEDPWVLGRSVRNRPSPGARPVQPALSARSLTIQRCRTPRRASS
jgi:hypothetical protein